jgi:hypothetical protein
MIITNDQLFGDFHSRGGGIFIEFKSGRLREKHAADTWNLVTISTFA